MSDSTAVQGRTDIARNADGTVDFVDDPNGNRTDYGYDGAGHLTALTPPAPRQPQTTGHDALSRVTSRTDGNGRTTGYAYDQLDRLTLVTFDDATSVSYSYDDAGRMTGQVDGSGTRTWAWDHRGLMSGQTQPESPPVGYSHDAAGNLTALTDDSGTVAYGYDDVNLVTSIAQPGGAAVTFGYDANNRRTSTVFPVGVTETRAYDASGRLEAVEGTRDATGEVLTRFAYDHALSGSDSGLRQSVTDRDGATTSYGYDELDRLISAVERDAGGTAVNDWGYAYNAAGNRLSSSHNGVTIGETSNAANQLTARGSTSFSYDGQGNLAGSTGGDSFAYDAANRPTSLTTPAGGPTGASYTGHTPVQQTALGDWTEFTDTQVGTVAVTKPGGDRERFTRDPAGNLVAVRGTAGRYYPLLDGLGSFVALLDDSGAVRNRYTYDPYGQTTQSCPTGACKDLRWRYTGAYHDPQTGLYKMGHRYYQPEHARFTQPDPLTRAVNPVQPAEGHPYAYVGCNPINYTDPTGLHATGGEVVGCAFGVAATDFTIASVVAAPATAGTSLAVGFAASQAFAFGAAGTALGCGSLAT